MQQIYARLGTGSKPSFRRWITFDDPRPAHGGQLHAVVYFNLIQTDPQGLAVAEISRKSVQKFRNSLRGSDWAKAES